MSISPSQRDRANALRAKRRPAPAPLPEVKVHVDMTPIAEAIKGSTDANRVVSEVVSRLPGLVASAVATVLEQRQLERPSGFRINLNKERDDRYGVLHTTSADGVFKYDGD